MWVVVCGWILIVDNLIKKGFSLANWCCMCRCSGEMVDHLLLHHDFSHELWSGVYVWDLVGDAGDGSISFFGWWNWFGKHASDVWNLWNLELACLI